MKMNIHVTTIAVIVLLVGIAIGRHFSLPCGQKQLAKSIEPVRSVSECLLAGGVRGIPGGKDVVFLPGMRMVFREDDWAQAAWIPTATLEEIGEKEKVIAVMMRSSLNDRGWVVFESQKAVLLSRSEIADLLMNRFLCSIDPTILSFKSSHNSANVH